MKRFLLCLFLLYGMTGFSQAPDSNVNKMGKPKLIRDSATVKKLEDIKDSMATIVPVTEQPTITEEDISRNMDGILRYQQEQRAKQKKAAIIRIVIGLAFLGVLVVGLLRRRKK
jgi:hypothetical protein